MSINSILAVIMMMLQASAAGLREPFQSLLDAQTRCHARPRLRGGAGNSGLRKGVSGDVPAVQLPATGITLADIVENARGPLQISCDGQHCYSWADAAAVVSPDKLEVVGMASGAILAGQWFLMEGSNGKFCNVTLVHRCLVDRQHLELCVDMLIVGGQARWKIQECQLWTWWGGVVACLDTAELVITDTLISGAGEEDKRCHGGVAAYNRARVGLRRCLIQQVASVGESVVESGLGTCAYGTWGRTTKGVVCRTVCAYVHVRQP